MNSLNNTYFARSYALYKETVKVEGDEEQKIELEYKKKLKLNKIKRDQRTKPEEKLEKINLIKKKVIRETPTLAWDSKEE